MRHSTQKTVVCSIAQHQTKHLSNELKHADVRQFWLI